jgi:hypothetical protein
MCIQPLIGEELQGVVSLITRITVLLNPKGCPS